MIKKYRLLIIVISTTLLLFSCKGKKALTEGEKATSTRHLVTLIEQAEPKFKVLNANNISLSATMGGKTQSVTAALRMITDSVIIVSVYPFLGIELYSVELYPDKWILYDKMNRKYATDDYNYLYHQLGITADFYTFQSLFSANLFSIGEKQVDYKKLDFISHEQQNELIYENQYVKQTSRTNKAHTLDEVILESRKNDYKLTMSYSDYVVTRDVIYPRSFVMKAVAEGVSVIDLNFKIQKISFNGEPKFTSSNQDRYTRTTIDQLMKQ